MTMVLYCSLSHGAVGAVCAGGINAMIDAGVKNTGGWTYMGKALFMCLDEMNKLQPKFNDGTRICAMIVRGQPNPS